ncbi:MAG: hypothetical protein K8H85_06980 [Cyclobacteriaceae bacterium]|nr:hypothetical protein [Cyclobacteriaceae bacterium]
MKIKIPPYPNFKITDEAFNRDVASVTVTKNDSLGLSNQLIMITQLGPGEKRVLKTRPVRFKGNLFVTAFPNPIHLFLSLAIENYNQSETIKEVNFAKCGRQVGKDIFVLDIEENGTHDCYNHYVKYRSSSIIMLVSSLEAFLNHIVPNDFKYTTTRKGKLIEFDKDGIESAKISFKEKLNEVIPQWLGQPDFWSKHDAVKVAIEELYENRKNIIHLKTNSEDDFTRYFPAIDKMLDLDILTAIDATIKFMNIVSPGFVEIQPD